MKFFSYGHLPKHLQFTSKYFCELAEKLDEYLDDSQEKDFALRKLLESKDCAVRANIK